VALTKQDGVPGVVPEREAGSVPEREAGSVPEREAGSVPERQAGEPYIDLPSRAVPPRAAVLVLHGGKANSFAPVGPDQLAVRRMQPFVRVLRARGDDLAVGQIRYRYRGWNNAEGDPVADVALALATIAARYGPVPVVLVGHSMGGRAALRAAGNPSVRGVVALAPWLPRTEPVEQFAGRDLVVVHGTRDRTTSPRASIRFVERAAPVARRVACLQVPWSGHGMLSRAGLWHQLTADFVDAIVRNEPFGDALDRARAARCRDCTPDRR
jgi:pimeloyl-ACP methyl ester carboxylesterase